MIDRTNGRVGIPCKKLPPMIKKVKSEEIPKVMNENRVYRKKLNPEPPTKGEKRG